MLYTVMLFIIALALLVVGGDWFVEGAASIARRFHMPEILVGATIVSIGTTLPEVLVSATSALTGHGEIAYGNAIGSIICNTSLIAAITIAIAPSTINKKEIIKPTIFFFVAALFYSVMAYITGTFSRTSGIVLLIMFVIYMVVTIRQACLAGKEDMANVANIDKATEPSLLSSTKPGNSTTETPFVREVLALILGAVLIGIGAKGLVDNGTEIAVGIGVPESVVGLTMVALGTSLPELITAILSLKKGHGMLSLGNIIGANLFNLVLVSGVAITISPFEVPASKLIAGLNSSLIIDIPLMFIVMLIMLVPALIKGKMYRWQGILLLAIYVTFTAYQFIV